jgi:hypothetical protein
VDTYLLREQVIRKSRRDGRTLTLVLIRNRLEPIICGWIEDALHLSKAKCKSASRTIIAIRIDNQSNLEGAVSLSPLCLLPNGTSPMRYEPHLAKWVLLFTQSTHRQNHLLRTQFLLRVHHHVKHLPKGRWVSCGSTLLQPRIRRG